MVISAHYPLTSTYYLLGVGVVTSPELAAAARSRPLGLVHFAHTDLSGLSLFEEAVHWGGRAATEVALALPPV